MDATITALTREYIEQQRQEWQSSVNALKETIARLSKEQTQAQQQEIALNGAIQACDVFLKKFPPTE